MMGTVFDIQQCSIHDGPGVRTTAFLKGCPLRCWWCHNPEGIDSAPELMITADRCLVCHACTEVCPIGDSGAVPAGQPWNRNACVGCGSCVDVCPADARELMGREYGAVELVDRVERDRVFFEVSGGGVTFSGGEPLHQPDFLVACLKLCRERGLHTAVDTCGLAPPEAILEVAGLTDLVLFDPDEKWTVEPAAMASRSRNTPFEGMELTGRVRATFLGGRPVYRRHRDGTEEFTPQRETEESLA